MSKHLLWLGVFFLILWTSAPSAFGWVYPEHRDIAILAVQGLDEASKDAFDQFWQAARSEDVDRLCLQGADTEQGLAPSCIDWAALSGIAGDHSCSSRDMFEVVHSSDWILQVADIAAQLKVDLARITESGPSDRTDAQSTSLTTVRQQLQTEKRRAQRVNALRTADTRLQRVDSSYATRADSNLAHFLLPRPDTSLDPSAYGIFSLRPGAELNAVGVYAWFHISALQKASRLNTEQLSAEERRQLARSMLFDEAFALHFLEDTYAAGHVAGSWGDVSQRKGTHDFYNQNGLEVFTWKGRDRTLVITGDAYMRPEDAILAAKAVQTSLKQVLDTAMGRLPGDGVPAAPTRQAAPDDFDICTNDVFPERVYLWDHGQHRYATFLRASLLETPVPGLGPGLGARPRARSEVGSFIGLVGTIDARQISGGFVPSQDDRGWVGGLDIGLRAGLGLEGALGDGGDGLVFAQIGFRADSHSTNKTEDTVLEGLSGSLSTAIPARTGLSARLRMPFYLVPGDLLLLSPMYFLDRDMYTQMAVTAANGGLIPWQQGWATRFGRFQFVLGRELGVSWFGVLGETQLAAPSAVPEGRGRAVSYKSLFFDLPILEFRPYRAFGGNQSSALQFQLFAGLDLPYGESVESPIGAPPVDLDPIYSLGLRMVFDWRYYFSSQASTP
ncbi:MAG: hypothetical protein P8Y96_04215 [Desulfuromonadales bacterium]